MGEVFHALQYLNRTMNLGLSGTQLLRAEMGYKSRLELVGNPEAQRFANDPNALAENFEIVTVLRRREQKFPVAELKKMATKAVKADMRANTKAPGAKAGTTRTTTTKGATTKTTGKTTAARGAAATAREAKAKSSGD